MTDDLGARLERAVKLQEAAESGRQPDAAVLQDLHARVARARRGRTASYAAVAAAAAAVVGVAGWFGLQDRTVPLPAHTPTSTPTPAPTEGPAARPTPTPSAGAGTAPRDTVSYPGMPPMLRAPDGILDQAGPGWFVVSYVTGLPEPSAGAVDGQHLVLSAPTGELYHLLDVTAHHVTPVSWPRAGVIRAVVSERDASTSSAAWVDLRTGEVTVDDRLPAGVQWIGRSGDDEVWLSAHTEVDEGADGTPTPRVADGTALHIGPADGDVRTLPVPIWDAVLAPDGRTVVGGGPDVRRVAVDVVTGRQTTLALPAGQRCTVTAWLDTTGVLASCSDTAPDGVADPWYLDEHGGQVVRLDATGGAPRTLAAIDSAGIVPWRGEYLRDGVVVTTAAPLLSSSGDCFDFCYGGAYLWQSGDAHAVSTAVDLVDDVCRVGVGGDGLLLWTADLCYEMSTGGRWWTVDEATGATRLVAPAGDPDLGTSADAAVERR